MLSSRPGSGRGRRGGWLTSAGRLMARQRVVEPPTGREPPDGHVPRAVTSRRPRAWRSATAGRRRGPRAPRPRGRPTTTPCAIGISTPACSARPRMARDDFTPSATMFIEAMMSSRVSPPAEPLADRPVARLRRGAGGDEVADPGQAREGHRIAAEPDPEPRHLGETTGDDRRLGVVAVPHAVRHAGRQGDDVLHRPRDLDAGLVVVGVDPEVGRHHRRLDPFGAAGVRRCGDGRGRLPLRRTPWPGSGR